MGSVSAYKDPPRPPWVTLDRLLPLNCGVADHAAGGVAVVLRQRLADRLRPVDKGFDLGFEARLCLAKSVVERSHAYSSARYEQPALRKDDRRERPVYTAHEFRPLLAIDSLDRIVRRDSFRRQFALVEYCAVESDRAVIHSWRKNLRAHFAEGFILGIE